MSAPSSSIPRRRSATLIGGSQHPSRSGSSVRLPITRSMGSPRPILTSGRPSHESSSRPLISSVIPSPDPALAVRIEPSYGRLAIDWRELWRYRELLYFIVWRDLKVRYKQTAIGVAWVILQPLFTMAIFTLFFGVLARMPSEGVPYPLFCFAGLVPWTFLANSLGQAAGSVVSNANLITKVYFPRLLVPLSVLLGNLPDLALSLLVLVALMAFYGFHPPLAALLWLSLSMALAFAVAAGAGLWLAALNVRYRDVRHTVPFLTQVWFFVTPVVYPLELLP